MDPSALENVSRSLESSLDFWGTMLLVATLLVVIGLVLEYWHDVKEFWEHVRWPMAAFPWGKLVALSGGILVTIGVFGELFVTYQASRIEAKLRENNHQIEALLNKEAGGAKTSAEGAAFAASSAKESADAAGVAAGKAKEKVEAVAKRAEEVDRDLAQTQFLVSARFVNDPKTLTEQLRQFRGQSVILRSYTGDAEGWGLCTALWHVAHDAEMNAVDECGRTFPTAPLVSPMSVSGPDDDKVLALAGVISRTGRLGVGSGPFGSAPKPPTFTIFVGAKSPFMIGQARGVNAPTKKQIKK